MILVALTGALAGLFHVLSGPDHLAAIAPLAAEDGRRGWFAGWTWGLGHASGVVVVALLAILLRDLLPPIDVLSTWGERVVGVTVIAMTAFAAVIGSAGHRVQHGAPLHRAMMMTAATLAIAVGAYWLI